jgi:hypothetical protein
MHVDIPNDDYQKMCYFDIYQDFKFYVIFLF